MAMEAERKLRTYSNKDVRPKDQIQESDGEKKPRRRSKQPAVVIPLSAVERRPAKESPRSSSSERRRGLQVSQGIHWAFLAAGVLAGAIRLLTQARRKRRPPPGDVVQPKSPSKTRPQLPDAQARLHQGRPKARFESNLDEVPATSRVIIGQDGDEDEALLPSGRHKLSETAREPSLGVWAGEHSAPSIGPSPEVAISKSQPPTPFSANEGERSAKQSRARPAGTGRGRAQAQTGARERETAAVQGGGGRQAPSLPAALVAGEEEAQSLRGQLQSWDNMILEMQAQIAEQEQMSNRALARVRELESKLAGSGEKAQNPIETARSRLPLGAHSGDTAFAGGHGGPRRQFRLPRDQSQQVLNLHVKKEVQHEQVMDAEVAVAVVPQDHAATMNQASKPELDGAGRHAGSSSRGRAPEANHADVAPVPAETGRVSAGERLANGVQKNGKQMTTLAKGDAQGRGSTRDESLEQLRQETEELSLALQHRHQDAMARSQEAREIALKLQKHATTSSAGGRILEDDELQEVDSEDEVEGEKDWRELTEGSGTSSLADEVEIQELTARLEQVAAMPRVEEELAELAVQEGKIEELRRRAGCLSAQGNGHLAADGMHLPPSRSSQATLGSELAGKLDVQAKQARKILQELQQLSASLQSPLPTLSSSKEKKRNPEEPRAAELQQEPSFGDGNRQRGSPTERSPHPERQQAHCAEEQPRLHMPDQQPSDPSQSPAHRGSSVGVQLRPQEGPHGDEATTAKPPGLQAEGLSRAATSSPAEREPQGAERGSHGPQTRMRAGGAAEIEAGGGVRVPPAGQLEGGTKSGHSREAEAPEASSGGVRGAAATGGGRPAGGADAAGLEEMLDDVADEMFWACSSQSTPGRRAWSSSSAQSSGRSTPLRGASATPSWPPQQGLN